MTSQIPAFLIAYSDSDFTNPHEAMLPDEPKDCRGNFTHMGAKYWGYETRRHKATTVNEAEQTLSYDHNACNWMLIGLRERAEINKITISTKWWTGNQVWAVSAYLKDELTGYHKKVLTRAPLKPDTDHSFDIPPTMATECFIECYYEGGISRINFFGNSATDQVPVYKNLLDGAKISHISDVHYGDPARAVDGNRQQMHMFGWESARTGFGERALFHLNAPAKIEEIIVDTYLHRLNAPLTCHVYAINGFEETDMQTVPRWKAVFDSGKEVIPDDFKAYMHEQRYLAEGEAFKIKLHVPKDSPWKAVLPFAALSPDTYHQFKKLENPGVVTHVLYMHYPHGGIHGLKILGAEI